MNSMVQILKSAIDSQPTIRFLQSKLHLQGCTYRRMSDEFDPPGDTTTLQQETTSSNNENENEDPISKDRQATLKNLKPLKTLEFKTEGVQRNEQVCHKKPDTSSEVAKPQSSKPVQQESLQVKAKRSIYSKSSCNQNSDFSRTKTVQDKQSEITDIDDSSNSSREKNDNCFSTSRPVTKPTDATTAQQKDLEFNLGREPSQEKLTRQKDLGDIHSSKSSCHKSSNPSSKKKRARNTKKMQQRQFKPQGFNYTKLDEDENDDHGVKKHPKEKKTTQKESLALDTPRINRVPSWEENKRLSQRRSAVCDKIEKQMRNQYGLSLRNMRKYMVMEDALREANLT